MSLEHLSHLVTVRNHLVFLLNNRQTVSKDKIRHVEKLVQTLDGMFLSEALELPLDVKGPAVIVKTGNENKEVTRPTPQGVTLNSDGSVVMHAEEVTVTQEKKSTEKAPVLVVDEDVSKRLAEEKSKVKNKPKKTSAVKKVSSKDDE